MIIIDRLIQGDWACEVVRILLMTTQIFDMEYASQNGKSHVVNKLKTNGEQLKVQTKTKQKQKQTAKQYKA